MVTRDFDFSNIRNYQPTEYAGIIVLQLPDDAVAAVVMQALESFLSQPNLVELWRVRFRPA